MEGQEAKGRACLSASPGSGPRSAATFLPQQGHCLLPNMGLLGGKKRRGGEGLERTRGMSGHCPKKPLPTSGAHRPSTCVMRF